MARSERAGVSFEEALKLAEKEEQGLADSASDESPASDSLTDTPTSDQPSDEQQGVLRDLYPEEIEISEQPLDSPQVFNVPGVGKVPLSDLIKGYMKDADYTQKTQEVAELRREAEDALELWKAIQEKPHETLRRLGAQFGSQPQRQVSNQSQGVDIEALVEQKLNDMLGSHPEMKRLKERQALDAVNAAFETIENTYNVKLSNDDRQLILEQARTSKTTDLESMFLALLQKTQLRQQRQQNVRSVAPRLGAVKDVQDIDIPDTPVKSVREAWDRAKLELKLSD